MEKRSFYKTAIAQISCAHFRAGDFVAVKYLGRGDNGTHWFWACPNKRFVAAECAVYPEHHLSNFVL